MPKTRTPLALRRLEAARDRERLTAWMAGRHATAAQMASALDLDPEQVRRVVRTMRAQGTIDRVDETLWALTGAEPKPRQPWGGSAPSDGVPRVRQVQARQLGLTRDPWTAALFGPGPQSTESSAC